MSKIENLEVKEYLVQFVIDITSKSKLFTSVFGKGFAKKSLETNLSTVYTNEIDEHIPGYYFLEDKSITLCTAQRDSDKLTVVELQKNKSLQALALHEVIHAMLTRTQKECKKYKIQYGTGISQVFEDKTAFGRGANEGLTNWICEKLGVFPNGYYYETTLVKQLELAIGEKNVMKMGKGNIPGNISRLLKMKPIECYGFLGIVDEIYKLNRESKRETGELRKETISRIDELVAEAESKIFDKYFKKKFEAMQFSEKISVKDYERFKQLRKLMTTKTNNPDLMRFSSVRFLKDFDELTKTFSEYARNSAKEYFKNGELTLANFSKLIEQTSVLGEAQTRVLIEDVSKMLYPNNTDIQMLLEYLVENGKLQDAKHYSIKYVGNEPILLKDGKSDSAFGFSKAKQLQNNDNIEDFINFTLETDENFATIINQFLQLESRVKQNDPKAKITIIDRVILVETKNRQESYIIKNGNILVAQNQGEIPIQFQEDRALVKKKPSLIPINKFANFRQKYKCDENDLVDSKGDYVQEHEQTGEGEYRE